MSCCEVVRRWWYGGKVVVELYRTRYNKISPSEVGDRCRLWLVRYGSSNSNTVVSFSEYTVFQEESNPVSDSYSVGCTEYQGRVYNPYENRLLLNRTRICQPTRIPKRLLTIGSNSYMLSESGM